MKGCGALAGLVADDGVGVVAGGALGEAGDLGVGELVLGGGEGDGQFAGGVDAAEEDVGDGLAAADAGVPGLEDGFGLGGPGHVDGAAVLQHDDGVGVGGGDGGDQRVLFVGKAEGGGVLALGHPLGDEDDGDLGGLGGLGCGGVDRCRGRR